MPTSVALGSSFASGPGVDPIIDPARRSGAELVEASAISRWHTVCDPEPWVTGWEFGDLLAGGVGPYHPNAAGMRAVADLLTGHVRR